MKEIKKLKFNKSLNIKGFISYFILSDIKFSTSDKFFNFQILGLEDDACVGFSLFKLNIEWEYELVIELNLFFIIHIKYKDYGRE